MNSYYSEIDGGIAFTSHENGDVVKGEILLECASTAPYTLSVSFLINGNLSFIDRSKPYQFLVDTTQFSEDDLIVISAIGELRYGNDVSKSISLFVNNKIDTGSFISVETGENIYHPDQMVTAYVTTLINTPDFYNVALRLNLNSPSGPIYFISNNTYPESVQWVVTFPLPSDAESGSYVLNVTAFGYMKGHLLWLSKDTYVFSVSGTNINDMLAGVSFNISTIVDWTSDLSYQNMTLNEILDRVKALQDDVGYLNISASTYLGDIVHRIVLMEANLSGQISTLDSSLQTMFAIAVDSILSSMDDIGTMLSIMDINLTELGLDLEAHDMAIQNRIDELEGNILDDIDSLNEYLELRMDQMSTYLQVLNQSLQSRMDDIEQQMNAFKDDISGDILGISSYLVTMNETVASGNSEILSAIDSTNMLLEKLEDATISEIENSLVDILGALEDINDTEARRHSETVKDILKELDGLNSSISDDLEQIDLALAALSKLDAILADMETLSKDVQKGNEDLGNNDGNLKVLMIVAIIILCLILILLGALVYLRSRGPEGTSDKMIKENISKRQQPMK
jgi:hypothetical protein